jgi:hypothetical protein
MLTEPSLEPVPVDDPVEMSTAPLSSPSLRVGDAELMSTPPLFWPSPD